MRRRLRRGPRRQRFGLLRAPRLEHREGPGEPLLLLLRAEERIGESRKALHLVPGPFELRCESGAVRRRVCACGFRAS